MFIYSFYTVQRLT